MTKEQILKVVEALNDSANNYQKIFNLYYNFNNNWIIKLLFPTKYLKLLKEVHNILSQDFNSSKEAIRLLKELDSNVKT